MRKVWGNFQYRRDSADLFSCASGTVLWKLCNGKCLNPGELSSDGSVNKAVNLSISILTESRSQHLYPQRPDERLLVLPGNDLRVDEGGARGGFYSVSSSTPSEISGLCSHAFTMFVEHHKTIFVQFDSVAHLSGRGEPSEHRSFSWLRVILLE